MEKKTLKLSGAFRTIPIEQTTPEQILRQDLIRTIEALLEVPEVRKAAANWASDELIDIRNAIQDAKGE